MRIITNYISDLFLAADNLRAQKTRTFLTALGIIFGVGSVIGMSFREPVIDRRHPKDRRVDGRIPAQVEHVRGHERAGEASVRLSVDRVSDDPRLHVFEIRRVDFSSSQ